MTFSVGRHGSHTSRSSRYIGTGGTRVGAPPHQDFHRTTPFPKGDSPGVYRVLLGGPLHPPVTDHPLPGEKVHTCDLRLCRRGPTVLRTRTRSWCFVNV